MARPRSAAHSSASSSSTPDRSRLARAGHELMRALSPPGHYLRHTASGWRLHGPRHSPDAPQAAVDDALVARLLEVGVLLRRGGGEVVLAPAAGQPRLSETESPLARLHLRPGKDGMPAIDAQQFAAGERLRADFERSHMQARLTSSWDLPTRGSRGGNASADLSDGAIAARQRLYAAFEAVGPELSGILHQVCCLAAGMEQAERVLALPGRSGKAVLAMALTRLARHYGLINPARPIAQAGIRHWAQEGSRPVVMDYHRTGAGNR